MTHRILIELSSDDPVAMTSKALVAALEGLSGSGVRVTGVEALDAELFVVASFLRLRLKAGPPLSWGSGQLRAGLSPARSVKRSSNVSRRLNGTCSIPPIDPGRCILDVVKYWVLAQTPVDTPADRPRDVRGWVHYHDDEGAAWGCRLSVEVDALDPREALGYLEFFAAEAPRLTPNQHIELFAGRQLMLVCDVLTVHDPSSPSSFP